MVGKRLKMAKYRDLQTYLSQNAHRKPLCPAYGIDIILNRESYTLFMQLDRHNKVYALYALRSAGGQTANTACPELILENAVLSALMDLIIFQCIT